MSFLYYWMVYVTNVCSSHFLSASILMTTKVKICRSKLFKKSTAVGWSLYLSIVIVFLLSLTLWLQKPLHAPKGASFFLNSQCREYRKLHSNPPFHLPWKGVVEWIKVSLIAEMLKYLVIVIFFWFLNIGNIVKIQLWKFLYFDRREEFSNRSVTYTEIFKYISFSLKVEKWWSYTLLYLLTFDS